MAFAQLTYRESLRDIEACLSAQTAKLYHMGFREPVRRSTLADANESRDWRIHAEFAQPSPLIGIDRPMLTKNEPTECAGLERWGGRNVIVGGSHGPLKRTGGLQARAKRSPILRKAARIGGRLLGALA
jgi:hypothetical protein